MNINPARCLNILLNLAIFLFLLLLFKTHYNMKFRSAILNLFETCFVTLPNHLNSSKSPLPSFAGILWRFYLKALICFRENYGDIQWQKIVNYGL